ncbi:hypothetical protein FB45DRAFT_1064142 [Roridomyces roridus]|uniref:F-box domain-containing protein n=1 Tax=Roridomyces roridus TaxID=1738132 RepID=A0AAD7FCK8_9AGAR|nr:hypothetical protein FB45DRAFT_1064142 [Roridomyces roridus]
MPKDPNIVPLRPDRIDCMRDTDFYPRALEILEIIRLVCQQAMQKSLPALSRTSRVFRDPALDVLWRHLRSLRNLVKCMPDGLWDFLDDDKVSLLRPIAAADWDRFLFYNSRVKSFHFDTRMLGTGTLSYPVLAGYTSISESDDLHHIRLFLGPRLTDLDLKSLDTAQQMSVLPIIAAACPNLENIDIDTSLYDGPLGNVYALVMGLTRPQTLSLPGLDSTTLYHLAGESQLTSLTLAYQGAIGSLPSTIPDERLFPSLEWLSITATEMAGVTSVVPLMRNSPLDWLTIDLPSKSTATTVAACSAALSSSCAVALSTLETLALTSRWTDAELGPAGPEPYTIRKAHLLPLLAFENLRSIRLEMPHMGLDDAALADMVALLLGSSGRGATME